MFSTVRGATIYLSWQKIMKQILRWISETPFLIDYSPDSRHEAPFSPFRLPLNAPCRLRGQDAFLGRPPTLLATIIRRVAFHAERKHHFYSTLLPADNYIFTYPSHPLLPNTMVSLSAEDNLLHHFLIVQPGHHIHLNTASRMLRESCSSSGRATSAPRL